MNKRPYTRAGDKGLTRLADDSIVAKTDIRIEAAGTLDELNANMGVLISELESGHDTQYIEHLQDKIFAIGAVITGCKTNIMGCIDDDELALLEHEIDLINKTLPPINNFVMPRGSRQTALCHVCRTVCRRAERRLLSIENIENDAPTTVAYINRLSDYLFVLARKINLNSRNCEKIKTISCD